MSHGEADVDLHAMRTLHARCRPASCVSFFFFSSSLTHSFSAPSKSLAKGTLRGTIGLDVSYFLFLREGELIVIIIRIKGGSLGGGEHVFIATVHTPMTKRVVTPFTLAMHSHVAVHLGTQVLRLVLQVALVDATTFLQTKANDRNADEI